MKKIFFCIAIAFLCILPIALPQPAFAEGETSAVYVVSANSAVVFEECKLSSPHKLTLKHKDEIEVEFEGENAKIFSGDGFDFYHITTTGKEGYVICDLVVPKNKFLNTIPKYNAKTNTKAQVFFLQDGKYVPSGITLPKHQRIFLYQGFNSKKTYNAVAFMHEDEVVYGFIKESAIEPDGVNPAIIACICVVIATLGIIFALLFMKRKKKKTGIKKQKT